MYKRLLLVSIVLLMAASAAISFAQSNQAFVQKAYWASDWGTWQVQGQTPNTYQFQPASLCQYPQPGGIGIFNAFSTNAPVYLQDAEPADSELLTPSFVLINETLCQVSLSPMHNHFSFSLRSGTAGLQEVLNQISAQIPYAVEVYLDRNWYTAVNAIPGQTAASVIASVQGNAAATLVDETQAPEVFYKWNGTMYVAQAGSGPTGPAGGVLSGSYPNPGFAASLALPNPTVAVTQSNGDNTTKVATDAFVLANSQTGPPTGAAGGILSGTYPNPGLAANLTFPNGTAAVTQSPGNNTNDLATTAFVLANGGGAPTGAAAGALSGTYPNPTIIGTTIQPKIINGVSYSALYTSFTDIGQRINACVTDAETKANGNTTGICSAEGEAGLAAGVTQHYPIVVGDTSGDAVTLLLPAQCNFLAFGGNFTGSVASTLLTQYSNTKIISPGSIGQCVFQNRTAVNGAVYSLYLNQSSTSNAAGTYAQMEGVSFTNGTFSLPVTTASTYDAIFQYLTDNSSYKNMGIVDFHGGQIPIQIGNNAGSTSSVGSPCCATAFENINVNGEYATAGILHITANSTNNAAELVTFRDISIDHPAPGSPIFTCTDTSGGHGVHVTFEHLYSEFEWNNSGQVAPEFIDGTASTANACGQINVIDQEAKNEGSYTAPTGNPIWQLNGTNAGSFNLLGFTMPFNATQPVEVVQNNMSGTAGFATATTDANGLFGIYSTETLWTPALTAGNVNVNGSVTSTGIYSANNLVTNTLIKGGLNGSSSSALGSAIIQGGANSGTGGGGSAEVEPGIASGGGAQGFAYTAQAFTAASALNAVLDVVSLTTTGDQIVDAPLGSTRAVGCAQTSASGPMYVVTSGKYTCRFDGTPVIGDFACAPPVSTGTVGQAHDNGTTACPAGQALGIVTGQVSGTLATVMIAPAIGVGGGLGGAWSGLSNPTTNLGLSMAAYTSTFTYNAATGTSDLFKLLDTANNTGTGIMAHFTTASGSSEIPWQADANGNGWKVDGSGNLASTNTVSNAAVSFEAGSGGASTCPTAVSGASFLCTNASDGISYSNNGAAYSPLVTQASLTALHMDYWNVQSALFATSTALSTVYLESNAVHIVGLTARLAGTISCTVAPTIVILDLGTSATTAYGSATVLQSLATGTSDGAYTTGAISVAVAAGHYLGMGFSAGTCATGPTFDIAATMQ